MKKKATDIKIYETSDYSEFKILKENRSVTPARMKKIKASIEKHGYHPQPILCNNKMEVIDGQGRLKACEELGIPVYFIIDPYAGIELCRDMNSSMTNWGLDDFILSYASEDVGDYSTIFDMVAKFSRKGLNTMTILAVALGASTCNINKVKAGELELSLPRDEIERRLDWIVDMIELAKPESISRRSYLDALVRVIMIPSVDRKRLYQKVKARSMDIEPASRFEQYFDLFTNLYNKNNLSERINFREEYLKSKIKKGRDRDSYFGVSTSSTNFRNASYGKVEAV